MLTAVFALRALLLVVLAPGRPDGRALLAAGGAFVHDPSTVYAAAAATMARTGLLPLNGWLGPPAGAILSAPFALLPHPMALAAWTAGDGLGALAGLGLVYLAVGPRGWHRPLFWLVAAYFPPLFADVDAGQLGGYLLLLTGAALWLARKRPLAAGVLAGLAGAVKLYPASMVLGAGPRIRAFGAGLLGAAVSITALGFLRLGPEGPAFYLTKVLGPALRSHYPDCAIDSVPNLYSRVIGGEPYALPGPRGLIWVSLPLHQPLVAGALTYVTIAALIGGAIWAARRSGWHPVYGPALALSLGALIPGEVNAYQFLPLLPIVLVTVIRVVRAERWTALALIGVGLLGFVRPPCDLPFPNLWTLAALTLFAVCACQNDLFRTDRVGARRS
ncbi:MAG: glycosyltransferase family 87 protein [Candidatus Dormibacteraceae bacterium]